MHTIEETKKAKEESKILSKVLFNLDPVNTMCKENDSFDEYDKTAYKIIEAFHVYEIQDSKDVRAKVLKEECVWGVFIELHDEILAYDKVSKILEDYTNAKNSSTKTIS